MSATEADGFELIETEWIDLPDGPNTRGARLAARIWLPEGARERPVPAVLEFLPYRRRDVTAPRDESVYPGFARDGVAGVRVDMRGTGDSDGFFDDEYSETELSDAESVIAWIARQPWCSGAVGMMGISWGGFNALQVAARRPEALKAVISIGSTVDRFADDIHYKGGAHLSCQLYWSTTMLANIARPPDSDVVGERWRSMWLERLERIEPLILPWLSHQRRDDFWRHGSICEDPASVSAPAMVISGWADGYRSTPWKAMDLLDAPAKAVTGPWIHKYPHFAFPHPRMDYLGEASRWWGRWLKGEATGAETLPDHRLFVSEGVRPGGRRETEAGRWVAVAAGADPKPRRLFLSVEGGLSEIPDEEAEIAVKSPLDCGADSGEYFTVDPAASLPGDQRADDGMSVCFETGPLETPLQVIGMPTLRLRVAIDAPQGNLVARLVDVHPDGAAQRVSLGVLNLSHRNSSAAPETMAPGAPTEVEIALDATGHRFRPGHKLRIAISTSYFPYILPAPTDVTATLSLGESCWIDLPSPDVEEITVETPADPDPLPRYPVASPGSSARRVSRAMAEGPSVVTIETDSGEISHPGNGMVWRETRRGDWSISREDPLSVEGRERLSAMRRRDGVETQVVATGRLRASATHWLVDSELTARENGKLVFERRWRREIPRDHM